MPPAVTLGALFVGQLDCDDIQSEMGVALEAYTDIVRANRGLVLQNSGDAPLGAFCTKLSDEEYPEQAVLARMGSPGGGLAPGGSGVAAVRAGRP